MRVAVIGLGKLGAPMAAVIAAAGHEVIGADTWIVPVEKINAAVAPVDEPGLQELLQLHVRGTHRLRATTDLQAAAAASELTIVIVPTPSRQDDTFDLTAVLAAIGWMGPGWRSHTEPHTVVIASTVMPGATRGPIRDAVRVAAGRPLGLVYSPEFIALGQVIQDLRNPDMILIGTDEEGEAGDTSLRGVHGDSAITGAGRSPGVIYAQLARSIAPLAPIQCLPTLEAEIAKLAINCYLTTKISFANMIGDVCEGFGADAHQVAETLGMDSRIGPKYIRPGGPYGGPCLPRDTRALRAAAMQVKAQAWMTLAAEATNSRGLDRVVEAVVQAKAKTVAILGLTYKPGTSVQEDAFGPALVKALSPMGCAVWTYDPTVHPPSTKAQAVVDAVECVIIATPWEEFASLRFDGQVVIDPWRIVSR